jgi:hypothetical protein
VTAAAQVIKGWTEAMQLMVEGDKWEMCASLFRMTFPKDNISSVLIALLD